MGQKVNPNGMRVGINRAWNSNWFANKQDFATFLHEDIKIRKYLTAELKKALLSHVDIERVRTEKGNLVTVTVFVALPGVVIGQDGAKVNEPDLDANLVAQSIAKQLEDRASFRSVQKKAIQKVMRAGAKGCKTMVSGRLAGADIARSEGYHEGIIPLHTLRSDIDYALAEAATTYGRLGCKVWICRGEIRPVKNVKKGE